MNATINVSEAMRDGSDFVFVQADKSRLKWRLLDFEIAEDLIEQLNEWLVKGERSDEDTEDDIEYAREIVSEGYNQGCIDGHDELVQELHDYYGGQFHDWLQNFIGTEAIKDALLNECQEYLENEMPDWHDEYDDGEAEGYAELAVELAKEYKRHNEPLPVFLAEYLDESDEARNIGVSEATSMNA